MDRRKIEPSPRQAAGRVHRKDKNRFPVRSLTPPQAPRNVLAIAVHVTRFPGCKGLRRVRNFIQRGFDPRQDFQAKFGNIRQLSHDVDHGVPIAGRDIRIRILMGVDFFVKVSLQVQQAIVAFFGSESRFSRWSIFR